LKKLPHILVVPGIIGSDWARLMSWMVPLVDFSNFFVGTELETLISTFPGKISLKPPILAGLQRLEADGVTNRSDQTMWMHTTGDKYNVSTV